MKPSDWAIGHIIHAAKVLSSLVLNLTLSLSLNEEVTCHLFTKNGWNICLTLCDIHIRNVIIFILQIKKCLDLIVCAGVCSSVSWDAVHAACGALKMANIVPSKLIQLITLLCGIRQVPSSDPDQDTYYADWDF
jgi:hypothetical protein